MYSPSRTPYHTGALQEVRKLYENADVTWLEGLGFESGYQLVIPRSKTREFGLATIADLAKLRGGIRVASPQAFLDRFGDGLSSMVRHYGLRLRGEPIIIEDPVQRVMELFRRGADVAVVRRTAVPCDPGLMTLSDSVRFFPRYDAALVARNEILVSRPAQANTLGVLEDRITT